MRISNDTFGNRTRDLPACSAMPRPTAQPPCPVFIRNSSLYFRVFFSIKVSLISSLSRLRSDYLAEQHCTLWLTWNIGRSIQEASSPIFQMPQTLLFEFEQPEFYVLEAQLPPFIPLDRLTLTNIALILSSLKFNRSLLVEFRPVLSSKQPSIQWPPEGGWGILA